MDTSEEREEKSFFQIVVHSFFIIPFLIAVFCVLLYAGIHLLTRENRSAYDYLEDIKSGGKTKRWQGAFELSKILSNPKLIPDDDRFSAELISAFHHAKHDDPRVRQYLALAMGRTDRIEFGETLMAGLEDSRPETKAAIIYSLGMLKMKKAAEKLYPYLNHEDSRIRSIAVVALGNIGDKNAIGYLRKLLNDSEPNVQWGSALSLANMGDNSGAEVIKKLLQREYLEQFNEVDSQEKNHLIIAAIEATYKISDGSMRSLIQGISETDPNMNVRSAALERLNTF